jgi:hypothetical protein
MASDSESAWRLTRQSRRSRCYLAHRVPPTVAAESLGVRWQQPEHVSLLSPSGGLREP